MSCITILDERYNINGNWEFIVNSFNWLNERSEGLYIPSKNPAAMKMLTLNASQANLIAVISCAVMPLAVVVTGIVVWIRRRNS
jgi:ABC-type uncharacterized transport system involved in gliding motility auxiliary subunit